MSRHPSSKRRMSAFGLMFPFRWQAHFPLLPSSHDGFTTIEKPFNSFFVHETNERVKSF
jgi:hypothetical protein